MLKIKLKWHKFWSEYHVTGAEDAFQFGSVESGFSHVLAWIHHADKYIELGGNPDDVYGKTIKYY